MRALVRPRRAAAGRAGGAAKIPPPPEQSAVVQTGARRAGSRAWRPAVGRRLRGGARCCGSTAPDACGSASRVGRFACQLAVTDAAVWVTRDNANRVVRIDRRIGPDARRARLVSVRRRRGGRRDLGDELRDGNGDAPRSEDGPAHPRLPRRRQSDGDRPRAAGSVWVGHGRDATWLTAIDPRSGSGCDASTSSCASPRWPRLHSAGSSGSRLPTRVLRWRRGRGELLAHVPARRDAAEAAAARRLDGLGDGQGALARPPASGEREPGARLVPRRAPGRCRSPASAARCGSRASRARTSAASTP